MPLKTSIALLLACATTSTIAAPGGVPAAAPRAVTSAGVIEGLRRGAVDAYLGVPYARPPLGPLRWRPPEPAEPWGGVRPAADFGPSCTQMWPQPSFGPYTREYIDTPKPDEDCLTLNVWTPASRSGARPVLVWIHGGGFGGGSGAIEIYDGTTLAARGIVVVTINYRVGPLGFLAHPELSREAAGSGAGNQGLQDMIAALRWVRDNAQAFGGDPGRVTIAGQSAGAVAVNNLIVAPAARGLFARAIAQSGSGLGIPAIPLADAERNGVALAEALGVSTLAQLREMPAERVQGAVLGYLDPPRPGARRIDFRPVLDGVVVPMDPIHGTSRVVSGVPLLTGFDADEFISPDGTTPTSFEEQVRTRFGRHADRLLALYPHATDAAATASARTLARDAYMAALYIWASERANGSHQRIYTYLYEHPAPTSTLPSWGTFHTSEVPYIFGVLDRARRPYTDADERIAAQLQGHWLNFIRTGDPNGRGLARWQRFLPRATSVMGIGDHPGPRPPVSTPERLEALRAYAADGGTFTPF